MLTRLHIKDLVIVRSLELDFRAGMTVLTGETGAGKSILIDALGLVLGERADSAMIRSDCNRAEITADFDLNGVPDALQWLQEQTLDDGAECLVRRVLNRDGRSRAFINGSPVPLQSLSQLGNFLVDIHGQHAHQSLLHRVEQRRLLDGYADHSGLLSEVAGLSRRYREIGKRLEDLQLASRDREARRDLLRYQVGELEALELQEDEPEQLEEQFRRLANAGRLQSACDQLQGALYEGEASTYTTLSGAVHTIKDLLSLDGNLREPLDLLESALINTQEAGSALRHYRDSLALDPEHLRDIETRLGEIHDLARKHRVKPVELPAHLQTLTRELAELDGMENELGELEAQHDALRADYLSKATRLSESRRRAAADLEREVSEAMHRLGMTDGRLSVAFEPLPDGELGAGGLERVEFLVCTNPGQPVQPLARTASGGELSRISLGIQVATARCGRVPTLIFDEVDVGIGGRVAEIVGQLLRRLGESRQVFCVTHLPQVAALGNHHLRVSKRVEGLDTLTDVRTLDEAQRVEEIARMLGGIEITAQTQAHAREMVERSSSL